VLWKSCLFSKKKAAVRSKGDVFHNFSGSLKIRHKEAVYVIIAFVYYCPAEVECLY
jgi:hypothetical protein